MPELSRIHPQLFSHHVGYPGPSNLLELLGTHATEHRPDQTHGTDPVLNDPVPLWTSEWAGLPLVANDTPIWKGTGEER